MFHLDVSNVDLMLHMLQWLYSHVLSASSIFRRMLQMFYLNVSKEDLVLQAAVWPPAAAGALYAGREMGAGRGSGLWHWLGTGRSTCDAGDAFGRGPRARRPGSSLIHKLILFLIKSTSII